jgi:hypothetical protein
MRRLADRDGVVAPKYMPLPAPLSGLSRLEWVAAADVGLDVDIHDAVKCAPRRVIGYKRQEPGFRIRPGDDDL